MREVRKQKGRFLKRLVSIVAVMVLCITGIDLSAFGVVSAEGNSGYKLEVEYSADSTSAVIKGKTDAVGQNIGLLQVTDGNGQVYDANNFEYPVTENGEYSFTLTYNETVDGNTTEKQQSLKAQVSNIVTIEAETAVDTSGAVQLNEVAEETQDETAATAATEAEAAEETASTEATTVTEVQSAANETEAQAEAVGGETEEATVDGFPATLPLETLKANAANLMAADTGGSRIATLGAAENANTSTMTVTAVTKENQIVLTEVGTSGKFAFEGGMFSETTVSIKQYNQQRIYYRALYVLNNVQYEISGLYPYRNASGTVEWYYVPAVSDDSATNADKSQISVGYLLPAGSEVWVEYGLDENAQSYNITVSGTDITNIDQTGHWKVNVVRSAKHKEKVVFEFCVPSAYAGATVKIRNASNTNTVYQNFDTDNGTLTVVDSGTSRYSGIFEMPNANVNIHIQAKTYSGGVTRYYGLGIDGADSSVINANTTYTADITMTGKTGKTPSVDWEYAKIYGSPKGNYNAKPTYKHGTGLTENLVDKTYYDANGGANKLSVAWGQFTIGEAVSFDISYGMYQYNNGTSLTSRKRPMFLRVDTYPGGVAESQEVSELVALPQKGQDSVTQTLSSGATVTVKCNGYGVSGQLTNMGEPYWDSFKKSADSYFKYSVTVSNMKYAFKAYINGETEVSQYTTLFNIDGNSIVMGSGECPNPSTTPNQDMSKFLAGQKDKISGSFWVGCKDDGTINKRYAYALTSGQSIWSKWGRKPDLSGKQDGYFEFYIQVKEGYSRPTVTLRNGNKLTPVETRNGYFYYTYNMGAPYPGLIDVSAKPITFNMTYRDGKGNTKYTDNGYKPATTVSYPIKNVMLDSPDSEGKYFQGWRIEYAVNGENQVVDSKIYSSGDVINLQDVYAKMIEKNYITEATDYDIYLVGVWGDRQQDSQVKANYMISEQKPVTSETEPAFTITYGTNYETAEDLKTTYTDTDFTTTPETVIGYEGTTAKLSGYKTQWEDEKTGKKYLLSPDSITGGTIKGDTAFAQLIYMSAVNVQFSTDPNSYGTGNSFGTSKGEIEAYNARIADRYYLPALNYTIYGGQANGNSTGERLWAFELYNDDGNGNNVTAIYNPGTKEGKTFSGWRVKTSTDTEWIIDGDSIKWLNLYNIAKEKPALWKEAVDKGSIVLEPVWEDNMGKITAQGGGLEQTTPENHSVTTGKQYSISNTFSYTGSWDKDGFSYALRKANGSGYDVWYSYVNGTEGTKKAGVTASVSNNDTAKTVTVTITIPANLVTKTNLQDQTLSLSAWNSVNGVADTNLATSALGMAAKVNNVFTTSPRAITLVSQATEVSTLERKGYEISSTFTYDSHYYTEADIKATVSGLSYAVYYKTKGGTAEKKWWKEDGQASVDAGSGPGVTYLTPTVDPTKEQITLKFWVGNIDDYYKGDADRKNSGSVDMKHDNSHYYIACWNMENGDYTIDDVLGQINGNGSSVPCTDITTRVRWRDPDFYVNIPSTITLEDGNGKSNDYAGKKVSISFSSDTSSDASAENGQYRVPNINVAVQGKITLTSADSGETREVLVCGADGTEITQVNGNYNIDTLAYNKRSIVAWLNTPKGSKRGEKWTGTATFKFTNTSIYPETSTVSENTDVAINTDL